MTERQIERSAERQMDALDRAYLSGEITDVEYKSQVARIDRWVNAALARRDRVPA